MTPSDHTLIEELQSSLQNLMDGLDVSCMKFPKEHRQTTSLIQVAFLFGFIIRLVEHRVRPEEIAQFTATARALVSNLTFIDFHGEDRPQLVRNGVTPS